MCTVPCTVCTDSADLAWGIKKAGGAPYAAVIVDPALNKTVVQGLNHASDNPLWCVVRDGGWDPEGGALGGQWGPGPGRL